MGNLNLNDEIRVKGDVRTDKGSQPLMRKIPPFGFRGWLATILIMAAGGTKNTPKAGTPNLHRLLNLGPQFAQAGERRWTPVYTGS